MKKIGIIIKEVSGSRIKDAFKKSAGVFVVKYSGVSSPDMSLLRKSLSGIGAEMLVVKNSVARLTMKDLGLDDLIKKVETPSAMIFFKDEPVGASKILCEFNKEKEKLLIEGGYVEQALLEKKDILALSKLPSKDVLRAQVVGALNSPILKFVLVLNQSLKKFVYCLDQIKQKKPN